MSSVIELASDDHHVEPVNKISEINSKIIHSNINNVNYGFVPMRDCLSTTVSVNTRSYKDLSSAIPYALEEELAEPVENLHFAFVTHDQHSFYDVLVTSRDKMDSWILNLNHSVDVLIPDCHTIPVFKGEWNIVIETDRALVRSENSAFECPLSELSSYLLLLKKQTETPDKVSLWLVGEATRPELIHEINELVIEYKSSGDLCDWIKQHGVFDNQLNLLSGEYAQSNGNKNDLRLWFPPAGIMFFVLIIHAVFSWHGTYKIEKEVDRLNLETNRLFQQAFPNVKRIVNPRVQAKQEMEEMRRQYGDIDNGFFSLFLETFVLVKKNKKLTLAGFNWKQGVLQLKLNASDLSQIERLATELSKKKYDVEIINAVNRDDKLNAQINIKVI